MTSEAATGVTLDELQKRITAPRPDIDSPQNDGVFIVGGRIKEVTSELQAERVKDHLASLLQVHNLVVLLGSGASVHLGSPQIRKLTNSSILELLANAGVVSAKSDTNLLALLNPDDSGDLEVLLNSLQLAQAFSEKLAHGTVTLGDQEVTLKSIKTLRSHLNAALAFACRLPSSDCKLSDPYEAHRTFLSRLARSRRENLPRPKIFTTNYDLVIESALDELGYPYIDGFSGTVNRRLNMSTYGLDFHRIDTASQALVSRAESSFYLHKIHGSLNWRASARAERGATVESIEVVQAPAGADISDGTVLIYPTSAKEGDTLAYPYTDLLRMLSAALQQPDTAVLTIGYGFWDAHINRILLGSLSMNSGMNIMIADPNAVFADGSEIEKLDPKSSTGATLRDSGAKLAKQPVGEIASTSDSRIAVFTGPRAKFEAVVELLPDPSITGDQASPTALAQLVESLGLTGKESLKSADDE